MKHLILFISLALLASGCVETAGTRVTIDAQTGEAKVLECSSRLAARVRVVSVAYADVNGIKKASVTIESKTHRRQELQARMVWLDADGVEVDADGKSFRAIVLDGQDVTSFTGMAPNDKCVTARVQLQETSTAY